MQFDLKTFHKAADLLELSVEEREAALGADPSEAEERIRETVLACVALLSLFHSWEDPRRWLRLPNKGLNLDGKPAVALMTSGELSELRLLRQHLEYWAYNGW